MKGVGNSINISAIISENSTLNRVLIDERTRICEYTNLYDCTIGKKCLVGTFTEIQSDCKIGDESRIQSHSFIPSGTTIGKRCFISHHFCGINDTFDNYKVNYNFESWGKIIIEDDVIVGSSVTCFPVTIKRGAIIAAGSVLKNDVGENEIWAGVPARFIKMKT